MSWGNTDGSTRDQDMISGVVNKRILRVDDVNDNDDDKTALHTINSSTDGDARALLAEGMVEVIAESAGNPATTGLKVTNASTAANANALDVNGTTRLIGTVAVGGNLTTTTDSNGVIKVNDCNDGNDAKKAAHFINRSTNGDARGLKVEGITELEGSVIVGPSNGDGLIDSGGSAETQQDLKIGSGAGTDDVHIKSLLVSDVSIYAPGDQMNVGSNNEIINITGDPIELDGNTQIDGNFDVFETAEQTTLELGTVNATAVNISRANMDTNVGGDLTIDGNVDVLDGGDQTTLELGTVNAAEVNIAHANTDTNVAADLNVGGDLTVDGDVGLVGDLQVGVAAGAGEIDAAGTPTAQNLKLGSNVTSADLELSRSGQTIKAQADLQMNSNELILDGSSALSSGFGFHHNSTGHGTGACIDVYIAGVQVGYWDSTGVH